ncbi:transcriptional regulator, TetR family [Paenibacillus sp. GP183]|nr:transcriptional regulator, TetR family [Paenibacillus sp. GP183]
MKSIVGKVGPRVAQRQGIDTDIIRKAAIQLADEHGLEQVSLSNLAAKLGIKTPSLYNHIAGLPGLRKQLTLYGLQQLKERGMQAVLGKSGDEAVIAFCLDYVAFARLHPGLYEAVVLVNQQSDPEIDAASKELVTLLLRILDAYKLEEKDALHMIRAVRSMVHGFAALEAKGGFGLKLDRDESLLLMLQTYLAGLHSSVT